MFVVSSRCVLSIHQQTIDIQLYLWYFILKCQHPYLRKKIIEKVRQIQKQLDLLRQTDISAKKGFIEIKEILFCNNTIQYATQCGTHYRRPLIMNRMVTSKYAKIWHQSMQNQYNLHLIFGSLYEVWFIFLCFIIILYIFYHTPSKWTLIMSINLMLNVIS